MNLLTVTLYVISASMLAELYRIVKGPTYWDKLLAANLLAFKTVVLLVIFSNLFELTYLLDVALVYGLIGYIGVVLIANKLAEGKREHD